MTIATPLLWPLRRPGRMLGELPTDPLPMHDHSIEQQLVALLAEAGPAHHEAFAATGGKDPEWASWYAAYVQVRLNGLLGTGLAIEEIARLLVAAEKKWARPTASSRCAP